MADALKLFTITRSKWLRGEGDGCSRLLREEDQKMCCLGQFLSRVHGVQDDALEDEFTPVGPRDVLPEAAKCELLEWSPVAYLYRNREAVKKLMVANDSMDTTEADREQDVARLFAELGYAVTFED